MSKVRDRVFFASDVINGSEDLAYQLGEDYGLPGHESEALAKDIEAAIRTRFAKHDRKAEAA